MLSVLNQKLFKKRVKVICIDNYITGEKKNILGDFKDNRFKYYNHDIVKPLKFEGDIDYIIHAAGIASPVYYMKHPLETIEVATRGTQNMLELARIKKPKSMLFFSSSEIYGDPDPTAVPTPETYHGFVSSVGPRACYDESKRLGETLAVIYHEQFGLPTKIVRPFNVFGPGMSHNDRRVLPMFAYMVLNKKPIPVHGDGLQTRTFCYITDAIDGFFRVLIKGKPGHAYNIGNDTNEISMKDLAELVGSLKGNGASYELIPYPNSYPAGEPMRRCPDISKAKEHLGFTAQTSLKKGISRFMSWCGNDPQYKDGGVF